MKKHLAVLIVVAVTASLAYGCKKSVQTDSPSPATSAAAFSFSLPFPKLPAQSVGKQKGTPYCSAIDANAEATRLIREEIASAPKKAYIYGKTVKRLVERDIPNAFEKMALKAFDAYADDGLIGTFLVGHKKALCVFDALENTCVADIDQDGQYELLSLWGWGSGLYRIQLNAYKFDSALNELHIAYASCWVPNSGYAELFMKQVGDTGVELFTVRRCETGPDLTVSYGLLKIDGARLIPTEEEYFPFKDFSEYL